MLERLKDAASMVDLPVDPEGTQRLALEAIRSGAVPALGDAQASNAAVAAFALGARVDPRYAEGEVLFKAALVFGPQR